MSEFEYLPFVPSNTTLKQQRMCRVFVSGENEISRMPKDVQSMFTIVQEKDFRVDISSSEIREKQQQQEKMEL